MINENEIDRSKYKIEYFGEKNSKDLKIYKLIVLGMMELGKQALLID